MTGFEPWYRTHHQQLLGALTLLIGDLDEAREVTAEAFSRALERWNEVSAMENPVGWTYIVALNVARRRWRRRHREQRQLDFPAHEAPARLVDSRIDVFRAVRSLPERARTAIVLRYFAELSEAEVAEAMGVALGTASATLSVARRRLADQLAEYVKAEELP